MNYVAYTFEECPYCGSPMNSWKVSVMPEDYCYEDTELNGLPTFCTGTSESACLDCGE